MNLVLLSSQPVFVILFALLAVCPVSSLHENIVRGFEILEDGGAGGHHGWDHHAHHLDTQGLDRRDGDSELRRLVNIHTFATGLGIKVWLKKTLFILCPNKLGRNARKHSGGHFYDIWPLTKSSLSCFWVAFCLLESWEFIIPVSHRNSEFLFKRSWKFSSGQYCLQSWQRGQN